jgi:hypothetical protein
LKRDFVIIKLRITLVVIMVNIISFTNNGPFNQKLKIKKICIVNKHKKQQRRAETEKQNDRETERQRERERETERQRDREKERKRETERQKYRKEDQKYMTNITSERQNARKIERHKDRKTRLKTV